MLWRGGWVVPISGGGMASLAATCVFVVAMINAFNFLDGSDGLAAGVAGIISIAYALPRLPHIDAFQIGLACAIAGACLAFLRSNLAPAKIYLGDSGSTSLGLCVAFLGLEFWRSGHATFPRMVFPVLIAALPLLDAALAIVRRISNGISPLYGDRRHFYDRLLARGWSTRRVALACYAITAGFVAVAWWGVRSESPRFWLAAALGAGLLIAWAIKLGCLRGGIGTLTQRISVREVRKDAAGFD